MSRTKFAPQMLQMTMRSHALISIFYEEVFATGLLNYKNSFEAFFEKYLSHPCRTSKDCAIAVADVLTNPPYNCAFGLYLIKNYEQVKHNFGDIWNIQSLLSESKVFNSWDLYRLSFGSTVSALEFVELNLALAEIKSHNKGKSISEANDFANKIRKHGMGKAKETCEAQIKKLHQAVSVFKGDFSALKQIIDNKIPRQALFLITGHSQKKKIKTGEPTKNEEL